MRLITADWSSLQKHGAQKIGLEQLTDYSTHLKSGLVLLPEGSFDPEYLSFGLDRLAVLAGTLSSLPLTIVGTALDRAFIIRQGIVASSQCCGDVLLDKKPIYDSSDRLYDVSPEKGIETLALIRICMDADTPTHQKRTADLLLIPSGGADWGDTESLSTLLDVHKEHLNPSGFIVQNDALGRSFAYSLKSREMLKGEAHSYKRMEYTLYDLKLP